MSERGERDERDKRKRGSACIRADSRGTALRIREGWRKAVGSIIAVGSTLLAAKEALPHGDWGRMFRGHPEAVAEPVPFYAVDDASAGGSRVGILQPLALLEPRHDGLEVRVDGLVRVPGRPIQVLEDLLGLGRVLCVTRARGDAFRPATLDRARVASRSTGSPRSPGSGPIAAAR